MKPSSPIPPNFAAWPKTRQSVLQKVVVLGVVLLFLLFWDVILSTVWHLVYLVLEVMELSLEDLLEVLFHLENHTAQMYTAWTGFTVFALLFTYLYLGIRRWFMSRFRSGLYFKVWLRAWLKEHRSWLIIMLLIYFSLVILV